MERTHAYTSSSSSESSHRLAPFERMNFEAAQAAAAEEVVPRCGSDMPVFQLARFWPTQADEAVIPRHLAETLLPIVGDARSHARRELLSSPTFAARIYAELAVLETALYSAGRLGACISLPKVRASIRYLRSHIACMGDGREIIRARIADCVRLLAPWFGVDGDGFRFGDACAYRFDLALRRGRGLAGTLADALPLPEVLTALTLAYAGEAMTEGDASVLPWRQCATLARHVMDLFLACRHLEAHVATVDALLILGLTLQDAADAFASIPVAVVEAETSRLAVQLAALPGTSPDDLLQPFAHAFERSRAECAHAAPQKAQAFQLARFWPGRADEPLVSRETADALLQLAPHAKRVALSLLMRRSLLSESGRIFSGLAALEAALNAVTRHGASVSQVKLQLELRELQRQLGAIAAGDALRDDAELRAWLTECSRWLPEVRIHEGGHSYRLDSVVRTQAGLPQVLWDTLPFPQPLLGITLEYLGDPVPSVAPLVLDERQCRRLAESVHRLFMELAHSERRPESPPCPVDLLAGLCDLRAVLNSAADTRTSLPASVIRSEAERIGRLMRVLPADVHPLADWRADFLSERVTEECASSSFQAAMPLTPSPGEKKARQKDADALTHCCFKLGRAVRREEVQGMMASFDQHADGRRSELRLVASATEDALVDAFADGKRVSATGVQRRAQRLHQLCRELADSVELHFAAEVGNPEAREFIDEIRGIAEGLARIAGIRTSDNACCPVS